MAFLKSGLTNNHLPLEYSKPPYKIPQKWGIKEIFLFSLFTLKHCARIHSSFYYYYYYFNFPILFFQAKKRKDFLKKERVLIFFYSLMSMSNIFIKFKKRELNKI